MSTAVGGPLTSTAAGLGVEVKENGWAVDATDGRESTARNLPQNTPNFHLLINQDYPNNIISEITCSPVSEIHPDSRCCRFHWRFGATDDGRHGRWTLRRNGHWSTADLLQC